MLLTITDLGSQIHNTPKLPAWILPSRGQSTDLWLRRTFQSKNHIPWSFRRNLDRAKRPKNNNLIHPDIQIHIYTQVMAWLLPSRNYWHFPIFKRVFELKFLELGTNDTIFMISRKVQKLFSATFRRSTQRKRVIETFSCQKICPTEMSDSEFDHFFITKV